MTANDLETAKLPAPTAPTADNRQIRRLIGAACDGLAGVNAALLERDVYSALYQGATQAEIDQALALAARSRVEQEPNYSFVAARLMLTTLYTEALGEPALFTEADSVYERHVHAYFELGVAAGRLAPELLEFDLQRLQAALRPERDLQFQLLGLQTIADRYLLQHEGRRFELPQLMFLRVAMGLAFQEDDREARAVEFYELLSSFRFMSATPTLFNAGTCYPQLSSCFLTTVDDDLHHIFKSIHDNAMLSKWAGGLGNDWTRVRAQGARIRSTNGKSLGIVPFLKVANDTAVAVNQGGKRQGAVCAYLEPWHLDIDEFLDLRKNTGDDRRRTHDMHTANWLPDLFMQRVQQGGQWTLFSPDETPDLHELYGAAFARRYAEYEQLADAGTLKNWRRMPAVDLWRKMITRLFETGHPWMTFKDPANIRSPQDHAGVVHSSNLCTEILLNTSNDETAVCNLGSVNLAAHIVDGRLDGERLAATVRTAMRMLDNVIELNLYPTVEAKNANLRHRPVGLGLMGFADALHLSGISYASDEALAFADTSMELISYHAILASAELAAERGAYSSYPGSKWERGLLPIDTVALLETERGEPVLMDQNTTLDWAPVREAVRRNGMRNSNVMAIAPTATISNIVGVSQSIEPDYTNLYVKSNLSGDFTQVNTFLVRELQALGLWDADMLAELKYYDGSVQAIERIPAELRERHRTAFEIEPAWLIAAASRRQKWIDMGQSLNLYMLEPNGRAISDLYMLAWRAGLKTTYYLRTRAATQIEKSTLDVNRFGVQPRWMRSASASNSIQIAREQPAPDPAVCRIEDPDCEACQ
jgi:ribonucleoside-diphosphate reductase alpha chain